MVFRKKPSFHAVLHQVVCAIPFLVPDQAWIAKCDNVLFTLLPPTCLSRSGFNALKLGVSSSPLMRSLAWLHVCATKVSASSIGFYKLNTYVKNRDECVVQLRIAANLHCGAIHASVS